MMTERKISWGALVRRHRSIFRFGGPWAQAIVLAIPWVNALVIIVLLFAVNQRMVVSPGVVFDLPKTELREGTHVGLTALMISVARDAPGGEETLIFFDDDRYSAQDAEQMAVLSERVKSRVVLNARKELLLLADKRVPHGDVMRFVSAMRKAGVPRVNVAEKPE